MNPQEAVRLRNITEGIGCPHGRDPEGVCWQCEHKKMAEAMVSGGASVFDKTFDETEGVACADCGKPDGQHGCDLHSYCCPNADGYHTYNAWSSIGPGDPI